MRRAIYYSFLLIVMVFKFLYPSDAITIDKGPLYVQNSNGKGVMRYLPNIVIEFRYKDTKGEDFKQIRGNKGNKGS